MTDDFKPKAETRLTHSGRGKGWTRLAEGRGGVVNPPVWRASTVLYDDVAHLRQGTQQNRDGELFYGRRGTPTQWALAEAITDMEAAWALNPGGVGLVGTYAYVLHCAGEPDRALAMLRAAEDARRLSATANAAHASLLVMMIKATAMHHTDTEKGRDALIALTVRTMNRILDEIVSDDVKG